jgi:hypothetical protein
MTSVSRFLKSSRNIPEVGSFSIGSRSKSTWLKIGLDRQGFRSRCRSRGTFRPFFSSNEGCRAVRFASGKRF